MSGPFDDASSKPAKRSSNDVALTSEVRDEFSVAVETDEATDFAEAAVIGPEAGVIGGRIFVSIP